MSLNIYPSPASRHLSSKGRLEEYLMNSGIDPNLKIDPQLPEATAEQLVDAGLAVVSENQPSVKLPFFFVSAVNMELTYGCNLACSHCLQDGLRPDQHGSDWADQEVIQSFLKEAKAFGLLDRGVNFTGGETFIAGSPILELIRYASRLGLNVRANTNAWWGGSRRIKVGSEEFNGLQDLVRVLRVAGLQMMALSLDDRYERYKGLFEKMIRVAAACEANGILYQVVMTDASSALHGEFLRRLEEKIGHVPEYFCSVGMEMVDVGGSRAWTGEQLVTKDLAKLPESSPCQTKGFYRPYYLHVSPTGDLRSCMYAPGSGSFGNIKKDKVVEIINRASDNPVLQLFASGGLEEFTEKYIQPWSHHYRQIGHPCTASAFVSILAEKVHTETERLGREPNFEEMDQIHKNLAPQYRFQLSN